MITTLEEIAESFSEDLPAWQRQINYGWLCAVHGLLKEGGRWGSPELGRTFIKRGDGFEEVLNE